MKNYEEKRSKAPIIITGVALLTIIGGVLCFIFKPYGDKFPFDDILYKVSKVTKMKYRILKSGKGRKIKDNDLAILNFSYRKKKQKDFIFDTKSRKMTWPFQYNIESLKKIGEFTAILTESVGMLKKKGQIRIRLTPKEMFSKDDNKKEKEDFLKKNNLTENSEIIVEIDVENITTQKEYEEENKKKFKEFTEKIKAKSEARFKEEVKMIEDDIKEFKKTHPGIKILKLQDKNKRDSGIRYYKISEGRGKRLRKKDKVEVEYSMKLFGDKKEMGKKSTNLFELGAVPQEVITGWGLIMPHLRVGDKIIIWIPSKHAYGITGAGNFVKPNQILVYEIKVLKTYVPNVG